MNLGRFLHSCDSDSLLPYLRSWYNFRDIHNIKNCDCKRFPLHAGHMSWLNIPTIPMFVHNVEANGSAAAMMSHP